MVHGARASKLVGIVGTALLCGGIVVACSGSDPGSGFDTPGSGSKKDSGSGAGDDGSGGFGGSGDDGGSFGNGGGGGNVGDAACAAESSKGQQQPLDIFIMLDQSGSMSESVAGGGDKWTAVTGALNTFVQSPVNGVSVGIQYFGLPPSAACPTTCTKDADCGAGNKCFALLGVCQCSPDSCSAADYSTADVEIAPLPGNAAAVTASIAKHSPSTNTPTSAALEGALQHSSAWATAHPDHVVITLFATDGIPSECDQSISNIAAIAATAYAKTPSIATFVIGVGTETSSLNAIAAGGGTTNAFIVDTTQNVNQQFLDALNKIRGAAVGCTYKIPVPASGTIDYNKVNVQYTANGGAAVIVPKVADKSHCPATGDAWYYDNNAAPTQIILCDASCKNFTSTVNAQVDVLTGCQSIVK